MKTEMKGQKKSRCRHLLFTLLAAVFLMTLSVQAPKVNAEEDAIRGIDVSKWQGTVNWAKVKKDGVQFVMLGLGRLNGNTPQPDPYFKRNINGALRNNIKVGVYLYSYALTVKQAKAEAQYVLDQIDGYEISYPVAFDIEDPSQMRLTTKKRTNITLAFLKIIEEAGYHPMIYASENWLQGNMDMSRLTKYDKWVAKWSEIRPAITPLSMWQYSSTGKIKGISGTVDLNYSYRNYAQLLEPRTTAYSPGDGSGWQSDEQGRYWYIMSNGEILKKAFKTIRGKRYFFDADGYRVTGWALIGQKRYYFNGNGVMKTGWLKKSGKNYYFDELTGAMQTGWITVDGSKYYLDAEGVRQSGWIKIGKKNYYLDPETGAMQTGWLTLDGQKYYLNKNGVRVTGTRKIGGKRYTFDSQTGALIA